MRPIRFYTNKKINNAKNIKEDPDAQLVLLSLLNSYRNTTSQWNTEYYFKGNASTQSLANTWHKFCAQKNLQELEL